MSNKQLLRISRNETPEASREIALLALSSTERIKQVAGQLVMSRYRADDGGVDAILVMGVSEGYGEPNYRILSLGGDKTVTGVRIGDENYPDVSELVEGQVFICKSDEGVWQKVYAIDVYSNGTNQQRTIEDLTEEGPYTYRSVEDNSVWYYWNGVMRAEYDFFTQAEMNQIVEEEIQPFIDQLDDHSAWLQVLDNTTYPLTTTVTNETGDLFEVGSINDLTMCVTARKVMRTGLDYKDSNVLSDCTFLYNEEEVLLDNTGRFIISNNAEDLDINIQATYTPTGILASDSTSVKYGYYQYFGAVPKDWESSEINILSLIVDPDNFGNGRVLSAKTEITRTFNSYGEAMKVVFIRPVVYGELEYVVDENGLSTLDSYKVVDTIDLNVNGESVPHYVFLKEDPAVLINTKQIFY